MRHNGLQRQNSLRELSRCGTVLRLRQVLLSLLLCRGIWCIYSAVGNVGLLRQSVTSFRFALPDREHNGSTPSFGKFRRDRVAALRSEGVSFSSDYPSTSRRASVTAALAFELYPSAPIHCAKCSVTGAPPTMILTSSPDVRTAATTSFM